MLDTELNALYESSERHICTEPERHKIGGFVQFARQIKGYERRTSWDIQMRSRLIESFLLNIPVPPITLWKTADGKTELLDGWQRINTLREFYADRFALDGLEDFPELNGRTYSQLPLRIQAGLDRRSIFSTVMYEDYASSPEVARQIKRLALARFHSCDRDD